MISPSHELSCSNQSFRPWSRVARALGAALSLALLPQAWAQDTAAAATLTLQQAIDTVLSRYPTLDAAKAAMDAARARSTQTGADRLPQVSAQGSYNYMSTRPYIGFAFPGSPPSAFYTTIQNSYTMGITVRQLLSDFGRTDAVVELAKTGELTAKDALEETRHQLGYQTIQAFYGTLLLRQSVAVVDEEIRALDEAHRIAEKKFGAGSATKFDVLTTEVREASARDRRTDTIAALEKQETALRRLLGLPAGTPLSLAGDFDTSRPALDLSTAMSEGLRNRPELHQASDQEEGARQQLNAAERSNRPTLSAQVNGLLEDATLPKLYDNKGMVVAGISVSVPIFTGNRISGSRAEAKASLRAAQAREHELRDLITAEVEDALSDLKAARARLDNAQTLVAQAEEALSLAKTRYANGVITNFELLDAQSSARAAELSRLQARYDCVLAGQALSRAAGRSPQA